MQDSERMNKAYTYARIFADPDLFVPKEVWFEVLPPILAIGVIDLLQRTPNTAHHIWANLSVGDTLRVLESAAVHFPLGGSEHGEE